MISLFFFAVFVVFVTSSSSKAPTSSCSSSAPNFLMDTSMCSNRPQTGKWTLNIPNEYTPGERVTFGISGPQYKGLLVTVEKGKMITKPGHLLITCFGNANSALSHDGADLKNSGNVFWQAPPAGSGDVKVVIHVVLSRTSGSCDYAAVQKVVKERASPTPRPSPPPATTPKPTPRATPLPDPGTPTGMPTPPPVVTTTPAATSVPTTTPLPALPASKIVFTGADKAYILDQDPTDPDWPKIEFTDSSWRKSELPIAKGYDASVFPNGIHPPFGNSVMVRAKFTLSEREHEAISGSTIRVLADDAADVYVNGRQIAADAAEGKSDTARYWNLELTGNTKDAFEVGKNVVAVYAPNKVTPETIAVDVEVELNFAASSSGGSVCVVRPAPSPPVFQPLSEGFACIAGSLGCQCAAGKKCDPVVIDGVSKNLPTCENGFCVIAGCVEGQPGCKCNHDCACNSSSLRCRKEKACVFSAGCPLSGGDGGCFCTGDGACIDKNFRCSDGYCIEIAQYTCIPGSLGCWCKGAKGDECDEPAHMDCRTVKGDRGACVHKAFDGLGQTPVVQDDGAASLLVSIGAVLAAVFTFAC